MLTEKRKDWDSDFFGYEIYGIRVDAFSKEDLISTLDELKAKNVKLVYCICNGEIKVEEIGGKLADIKLIYSKQLNKEIDQVTQIRSYAMHESYKNLLSLSYASGEYSRFKLDENFANKEFERLYEEWIKNSVSRNIADEVLVYYEGHGIHGMVTVSFQDDVAKIGLISVAEGHRGKNIGGQLLKATEREAVKNNCNRLNVATQKQNSRACNFYEKNGYSVATTEYIYHFWL